MNARFEPTTINRIMAEAIDRYRQKADWLNYKAEGRWHPVSASELVERIRRVALGLYDLGIRPGDRVALLSENRLEWTLADLGALALGAIDVPIYATQAPGQVGYILRDSGARLLFISTPAQWDRVHDAIESAPELERVIGFDPIAGPGEHVISFSQLEARGQRLAQARPELYEQLRSAVKPDDLATIIYTSGTTGEPKGVMLTHWNLASNALAIASVLNYASEDIVLSILPLCHVFERTAFYVYLYQGVKIYYAESIDRVPHNLREVRPTIVVAVPRLFEKMYEGIIARAERTSPLHRQALNWAVNVGKQYVERQAEHLPVDSLLAWQYKLAYRLVLSKWRSTLGLDRLRYFISGGAPLSRELALIFFSAGIEILQGYGLTETSPGLTLNPPAANKLGTAGRPLPGIEIRIAEDGEILARGPNVMKGYYNRQEDTERAFTEDGWLKTGDVGYFDEDGYLVITDRKKDLIKTSGGKYVAPQMLEGRLKLSPFVSDVAVVGNQRKFVSALIVPHLEAVLAYAEQHHIAYGSVSELLRDARILALFEREIEERMADLSRYERVKKFALLEEPFSVDSGELTPTMKLRRRQIEAKYKKVIDELYAEASVSAVG